MVGFGSIGQGVLPLLLRHLTLTSDRVTIVTAETRGQKEAELYGVRFIHEPVTRSNYRTLLEPLLSPGDALVNLSVDVSSVALIELARQRGALYIDTCIEPWLGGYTDPDLGPADRSNYALRESALALGRNPGAPTAVLTHGANPGLVSHFTKRALLDIAAATGTEPPVPADRAGWASLAQTLGVKVIHVAERDTQVARFPKKPDEFVNTWSIDGFVGEGCQPAELGWGSHERHFPADGHRHAKGSQAAIWLARPGAATRVRTWTPLAGPIHGFLITHNEAISLADYLTVGSGVQPQYRPTVHYAYHPSDDAVLSVHEFAGRNYELQPNKRLMMDEITEGMDELGVLLAGHAKGAYWYGSRLTIGEARELAPHNNATSLQVTAAVLGGLVWAIENPDRGLVEPEEMDHERVLQVAAPYLGELAGAFTDWNPLQGRGQLFPEDIDPEDPWQFKNIRVV
jgi:homospermidine synthase